MKKVDVPLVTRVEGHGHVNIRMDGNRVRDVSFGIHEGPRYFEGILVGRRWDEIPELAARICGICTVIHSVGSAMAIEDSAGFSPPEELDKIRRLLTYSAHIQSHVLHLYFLTWPDYVGKQSALHAYPEYKELVRSAFRMKEKSNEMTEIIGGRMVHPCTVLPGKMTKSFEKKDMKAYTDRMRSILNELRFTAEVFADLEYPDVEVPSEHLALYGGKNVPLLHGELKCTGGLSFPARKYTGHIEERVVPPNTTKRSYIKDKGFMVGALPRLNINHKHLRKEAREIWDSFPSFNIHHNNLAQGLESYHYALEAIDMAEELMERPYVPSKENLVFDGGEGVSAVEAPRGILIHHYRVGKSGKVEYANIITPTAFNFEHVEMALKKGLNGKEFDENLLRFEAERIIRAYDPCISCSAHIVRV